MAHVSSKQDDPGIIGIGTDHQLWLRDAVLKPWQNVPNSGTVLDAIYMPDGTILGVGTNYYLYTRQSLNDQWNLVPNSNSVVSVTIMYDGTILGVGTDAQLYTRKTLNSAWELIPHSGNVISVTIMRDRTILGVGTDHQMYVRYQLSTPWEVVPDSGDVLSVTELVPSNQIVGVGTDQKLYSRPYLLGKWEQIPNSGNVISIASMPSVERPFNPIDTFDHVVVLMLENRSFDNLLGYLYSEGVPADAPLGKTFEGITVAQQRQGGSPLSNPFPPGAVNPPPADKRGQVEVGPVDPGNYFQPYPDPGEEYPHINTQLFNYIDGGGEKPYNLPNPVPSIPPMMGFVKDYIENYKNNMYPGQDPAYDDYKQIMQCYTPEAVPVLSTLAKEFAVFDHWFCAVPSQTWCNRAFWNAGTSWGKVINGPSLEWTNDSVGATIFNQIHSSGFNSPLDWRVYSDQPWASLTGLIHAKALAPFHIPPYDKFPRLTPNFFNDCAAGNLPAYSFLEPRFWTPHNDMHPSTPGDKHYDKGPIGSVLLGEYFVKKVYDAIRTSSNQKPGANNSQNTLLIITFDEHGGCYDHVPPPEGVVAPDNYPQEDDFNFLRLGVRVPMIMVSAHIAKNTIVNTPMHHASFAKTVGKKWNVMLPGKFPPLTARVSQAPEFSEVFTSIEPRQSGDWPTVNPAVEIPKNYWKRDFSGAPLSELDRSILNAILQSPQVDDARKRGALMQDPSSVKTIGEAEAVLKTVPGLREPGEMPSN